MADDISSDITPILMPKWGLSMSEGTLADWHVEEGAQIAQGDEIMDVETDKITNVVEAADAGLLRRRVAAAGEVYPVRALLAVMAPPAVPDEAIDAYIAAYVAPVDDAEEEAERAPAYAFAELPVGPVRYAERPGEGTPFVLIHGFGGDLDNWLFNIDALAADGPVFALDLPGHGQSIKSCDSPGLDLLVDTLVAWMDQLGITQAHFAGHSMGGLVAARAALTHPARAASLSLICSAGLGEEINSGYIDGFVNSASRKELKPALVHLFKDSSLVNRALVDNMLKYKRLDGVQSFLQALATDLFAGGTQQVQIAEELAGLEVPVQLIWGAADAIIPAEHTKRVTGVAVHLLADAGHMVQMEQAGRVNELLKSMRT